MIISAWVICHYYGNNNLFFALISGLLAGILIGEVTKYYTSDKHKPVLEIAKISKSGTSLNIIEGLSQGMISTAVPTLAVVGAMIVAFDFAGLYGIALAAVGILATLGINLSSDCYGPIVDNAAGISAMAGLPSDVRQKTDALDSVGNTTAATGKGFAIGSAALAALAWITVFFEKAGTNMVNIIDPRVIGGFFIGGALSFFFCAITMKAVSRGAFLVVDEARRQFKEIKGIMKGKEKPEYSKCVDLITKKALKEMILPGFLAISVPILTGVILGIEALGGLLLGALVSGFLLAVMMSNAGGAWDNAKKYIEMGNLDGKGSEAHKASIIGDTVGDPMKDTSGPSLNILIKLVGEVSVIFMPLFLLLK
jgi:K(+)-stimulated pyrophosphate-energized sodium pump